MPTNTPLISVCIAAYNAEKYLEATLRTVLAQTYKNWEIIVTEDGSTDRTETFVDNFSAEVSQRVVYNRHDTNLGLPTTRNTGIASAWGEWVAFLDADDLWKPDHLDNLLSASHIEECDAVYAGSVLYDDATWTKLGTRAPSEGDLAGLPLALYAGKLSITSSAVMVKREALARFGPFSKEFPVCSTTEYWLRILSKEGKMFYSGNSTCIYRQRSTSLSSKNEIFLAENARLCESYSQWAAIPRSVGRSRPADLYRQLTRALLNENPAAARASLSQALRLQPLSLEALGLWARLFLKHNKRPRER